MRSFINAIFSILLSSIEPYLSQNMYTPQTQPRAQVLDRTVEEQLEGYKKTRYSSAGSANVSHRHHKTTACSGSMEYWVRNGPEGNDPDFDEFTIPPTSDSPISLSEISKDSVTYPEAPRLDPIARCVTPPSVPNLTLDISTMINTSSTSSPPSTPGLPSISFSPLLRATRLALDADASRKASLFGLATATPTAGKEASPLFGLGIFDVSRKEDCSHAFDGLGIVRIQSSPWRPKSKTSPVKYGDEFLEEHGDGDQDCNHISETFLHDLEAFFLVRDFTPSSSGPLSFSNHCSGDEHMTFDNIIEEPTTESGEGNSSPMKLSSFCEQEFR
ncbi:hypothetical protein APHAL10511_001476 [Amanita phalloides]|nr:hypothetical protein APHAL10511_001476 [Amanita phalloides]